MDRRVFRLPSRIADTTSSVIDASPDAIMQGSRTAAFRRAIISLIQRGRSSAVPTLIQGRAGTRSARAEGTHGKPSMPESTVLESVRTVLGASVQHAELSAHVSVDHRENNKLATVRESRWAIDMWRELDPDHRALLLENIRLQVESVLYLETQYPEFKEDLGDEARHRVERSFAASRSLGAQLDAYGPSADVSGVAICELLGGRKREGESDFKTVIDGLEACIGSLNPKRTEVARDSLVFKDRGRQPVPSSQYREHSAFGRHGGITDADSRTRSMENLFSEDVEHYKGLVERAPDSQTARLFRESGTPFIGGASGSMESILLIMHTHNSLKKLTDSEFKEREILLGLYSAMLVAAGHHSVMECIMPARSYGYFKDVPDPLESGYTPAIQALANRLGELGLDDGPGLAG